MDRADVIEGEDNGMRKLPSGTGWVDAGASFLRHGWWLGKRVAIVGAASASALVVIPPLLILSTLGLMLSFPFGVLFVGYACADKIMKIMLPMPPSKMENDDDPLLGAEQSTEIGVIDPVDKMTRDEEKLEKRENLGMRSEGCGFTMVPEVEEIEIKMLESGSNSENQKCVMDSGFQEQNNEAELPPKMAGDEGAMVKVIKFRNYSAAEAEESRERSGKITEELVREGTEPGEELQQSVPVISAGNGAPPDKRSYAVVVMSPREDDKIENEPLNLSSEHLSIVQLRGKVLVNDEVEDLRSKQVRNEKKEEGGEGRKDVSIVDAGVVKEEDLLEEHRQEIETSSLNAEHEYFIPASMLEPEDAENLERGGSMEHPGFVRQGAAEVAANVADVRASDVEESDEKKLWDQVLAVRTIVGCKTKLCSSIGEELRALYLFTGVEPPVALKEGVDLAEMAERTQFLKGIVGMK